MILVMATVDSNSHDKLKFQAHPIWAGKKS